MADQFDPVEPPRPPASPSDQEGEDAAPATTSNLVSTIVTVVVIAMLAVGFLGLLYYKGMIGSRANARTIEAQSARSRVHPGAEDDNLQPETVNELKTLMHALSAERDDQKASFEAGLAHLDSATKTIAELDAKLRRVEQVTGELQARGVASGAVNIDPRSLAERTRTLFQPANDVLDKMLLDRGLYGWKALEKPFTEWAKGQNPTLTPEEIHQLHDAAQVQREAVADQHLDIIPDLARKRAAQRIPRDDLSATVQFVWNERANIPPFTAGQLVSIASLVAKASLPSAGTGTTVDVTSGLIASLEPQELVSPRDITVGFIPAKTTDLVMIAGMCAPYLAGGAKIDDQDQALAAFLTTRARSAAVTYIRRGTGSVGALITAITDEGGRFARIPHVLPTIDPTAGADQQRAFTSAVLAGLADARAIREGVFDQGRIGTWAKDLAASVPNTLIAGLELSQVQRSYGSLIARDPLAPIQSPLAAEAMDRAFVQAVTAAAAKLPERYRQRFVARAAVAAATVSIVEARTGESPTIDGVTTAIKQVVVMTQAAIEIQEIMDAQVIPGLVDTYAALFDTVYRDWSTMPVLAQDTAAHAIDDALASVDRRTVGSDTERIKQVVLPHARLETEGMLARTAAIDVIQAQITRDAAKAPIALVKLAREHAVKRASTTIIAPMTHEAVIRQTWAIAKECQAIATGKRRIVADTTHPASPATGTTSPAPGTAGAFPGLAPGGKGPAPVVNEPIGLQTPTDDEALPAVRKVTIPAGAYAKARVFSGVMCELGRTEPEHMLVNMNYAWSGPAGSTLMMRDLRVLVDCTAMNGAPRVRSKIVLVSYQLPDGRRIKSKADGWVVDDAKGIAGTIGEWQFNWDVVIPLSTVQTGLSGLAGLLRPTQQVTSVNVQTTVIQPQDQPPSEKLGGGVAQGASDSVGKQVGKILDQIVPAIEVPNNQAVTIIMNDDVVLDVPVDVWDSVVSTVDPTAQAGFTH